MQDTLPYIQRYFPTADIINIETDNFFLNKVPDAWVKLFELQDFADRKNYLLNTIWRNVVSNEMRNTISYLEQHLTLIELLKVADSYSILYGVTNEKGKVVYYKGDAPASTGMSEPLQADFPKLPDAVKLFYTQLHDGFYYLASESMGLVPLLSVTRLADEE
ncbi:MAG: hypothetical protein EOP45_16985 [Sphingobacteriaceae bacterium]|nr:MAG: hypothetical protein EOP45_16985 [Sphingobacteriaceae bacterium]